MNRLSKSRLLAFRQCPKRLWLEVHKPGNRNFSAASQRAFDVGHTVGSVAQRLYAPDGNADFIDADRGNEQALTRTQFLLQESRRPIFEATFAVQGAFAYADVLLPMGTTGRKAWRMVEVKSSTTVKDYQREDVAIQAYVARKSGLALESIALATVDSAFVYPGDGKYQGLLKETDLTDETLKRAADVAEWISAAHLVVGSAIEPIRRRGPHCTEPFGCGFVEYCSTGETPAAFPVAWLPRTQSKALATRLDEPDVSDMTEVSDELLNELQQRVKHCTVRNTPFFDAAGANAAVSNCKLPLHALDFETISFVVPVWAGTSPYAAVPFQYSFHSLLADGTVKHKAFLDLSGEDPARALAQALIVDCAGEGLILTYSGYERQQLIKLAERFADLAEPLNAIVARLFDLLPICRNHYYHPSQRGSWSIKKVLPALAGIGYEGLEIAGGQEAMDAYEEAIQPATSAERREQIRRQLLAYCALDTKGLLHLWRVFADQQSGALERQHSDNKTQPLSGARGTNEYS